ncbi:MAG: LL-diaminopimelate aminotransferase [Chloroflexi bacterium]|nr:LL-diaminopimelate aminotransferase [Chloroflexota bacterium]
MQKAERLGKLPPYLFVTIRNKIREARERGVDVISLGVGDPDQPTPPHVVQALQQAAEDPANHVYPTDEEKGMLKFRQSVATWYDQRFGVKLDPEKEVLALIGSKEGNHHLCLATLNPGDTAILPDPGYPAYFASAVFAGAEVARIPLSREDGFLPRFDKIPEELSKTAKLLFLCYPNNPTGAVATLEFWQEAVAWAKKYDVILVNDHPYSEVTFDGYRSVSILEAEGAMDVAVEFNSLSKPYNMTGWRIGMAVGNADLIAGISQVKENTDSGIFNAIQYAGIAALEGPQDGSRALMEMYKARRDRVLETLRAIGLNPDVPKATFYVWSPTPAGMTSADFAAAVLDKAGVVVTPGRGYGEQGEGFFRISLTIADARLDEALARIKAAFA